MSIYEILMVVLTVARLVLDIIKLCKASRFARCRGIRRMDMQACPLGSLLAQMNKIKRSREAQIKIWAHDSSVVPATGIEPVRVLLPTGF